MLRIREAGKINFQALITASEKSRICSRLVQAQSSIEASEVGVEVAAITALSILKVPENGLLAAFVPRVVSKSSTTESSPALSWE